VCTGIYALAPTGLLDGRQVTTHWRFARDLAQRFLSLKVNANALFIKDDKFYTSAGITSGLVSRWR
jgi:transcriptional regulator GlxA family with amidase domain